MFFWIYFQFRILLSAPLPRWIRKPTIFKDTSALCRNKRLEPEGAAKCKEVNNNIKRSMKKAKENWIGEQCSKIEENLRKNNSKQQEG